MFGINYDEKYKLIDEYYLEENIDKILSLNEYIPSILTGIMCEIYIDPKVYSQWKESIRKDINEDLWHFYIKQKALRQQFSHENIKLFLPIFLELLIFLDLHPEFEGMIKDWDYLDELVDQCEKEYDINIMDYINNYNDLRRLLTDLRR